MPRIDPRLTKEDEGRNQPDDGCGYGGVVAPTYPRRIRCPDCGHKFTVHDETHAQHLRAFGCINCARARVGNERRPYRGRGQ